MSIAQSLSKITLADLEEAKQTLAKYLPPSPLLFNPWLSEKFGCKVFLKLENMQPIGSFKIRGATYKISKLTKEQKKKGVIAASAGNHAQGVAWGSATFGVRSTIVMPKNAPLTKILNTKALGAEVILEGDTIEDAFKETARIARKSGAIYIPPYEDFHVVAGQGTAALEIADQLPNADVIIGSMGGGGLMAGVGVAMKALRPRTQIYGVQATGSSSLSQSIRSSKTIQTHVSQTFADGIRVKNASPKMLAVLRKVVDRTFEADDELIAEAVLTLIEKAKTLAEGAGALPLAVLKEISETKPALIKDKNVVLIISGGNIDVNVLGRIIDRGLIRSGRRLRINAFIKDTPGSLNKLTGLLAAQGANVLQVIHDRELAKAGLNETGVEMTLETRGPEHSAQLIQELKKYSIRMEVQ